MKLTYIVNRIDGPGGLERVLSVKASYLADVYNYDVYIVTLNQENDELFYDFSSKIKFLNVKAEGFLLSTLWKFVKGFNDVIKEIKPDVIAVCDDGFKGFLQPYLLRKPCPMIYERHVSIKATIKENQTLKSKINSVFKTKLMKFGGEKYDKFIVLTEGNLKEWDYNNLKVIPNPLSFYPSINKLSRLNNKRVLAVGKQSYQKGYDRLLKSWKLVTETNPDWMLEIYGTINSDQELDVLAKDLNISNNVLFFPPVKNIEEKYEEASIYVMSSRYEGFGMVLIEAMSYGVPCISFDCPFGPSDIISDNLNGFLVKNGDENEFANKLKMLIEDSEKRNLMGKMARKSVEEYMVENILKKWNELFKQLILTKNN